MGWEFVAYVVVIGVFAVIGYVVAVNSMGETAMPDPRSDMQVTTTKEGAVIPIVYGTVRIPGNIIWYGNLKTTPNYVKTGGKGGGKKKQQQGWNYYIDVWEGICWGQIELLETYIADDRKKTISAEETIFNDGTETTFPNFVQAKTYEHTKTLTGAGPTYSLGQVNILPRSISIAITYPAFGIALAYKDEPVLTTIVADEQTTIKTEETGRILAGGGAVMTGWSINYRTGILTLDAGMAGNTVHFWRRLSKGMLPGSIWQAMFSYVTVEGETYGNDRINNEPVFAESLDGIAHIAFRRWHTGVNVTTIPSATFVVKRTVDSPIDYANMSSGTNPAAIIYDIMTNPLWGMEIDSTRINLASFNAAAAVWNDKGYGLNIKYMDQRAAQSNIEQILGWVGGSFYQNQNAEFCLHAYQEDEVASVSLDETMYIDFTMDRPGWESTKNDLRINWTDAKGDYVQKTYGLFDSANYHAQRAINQLNVDLLAFNDYNAVSRRGWELLKIYSYPALRIGIKLAEKDAYALYPGCVVSVSHASYEIEDLKCRVLSMDFGEADNLTIAIKMEQVVECNIDASFGQTGTSNNWTFEDYTALPLAFQRVFELPWNPLTQNEPYYAMLGARIGQEDICAVTKSIVSSSASFVLTESFITFSQYGVLNVAYPATTKAIDDEVGIIYIPFNNDLDPEDLVRKQMFSTERFLLIDNEIMAFQFHLPYGDEDQYQILGVIRGLFGTTIAAHADEAPIWIFNVGDQILPDDDKAPFWIKMLTGTNNKYIDETDATAIAVTPARKAEAVFAPSMIEVTVASGTATIIWYPRVKEYDGAGFAAETAQTDTWPFEFDGDFEYTYGSTTVTGFQACTVAISVTGTTTFQVRHRINGVYSSWKSITFSNADGTYLSDVGTVTY